MTPGHRSHLDPRTHARRWSVAPLLALLAVTSLAACGGDDDDKDPGDTLPPTVAISDDTAATASGDVVVSFAFSEDVGTSFDASDVALSAGTKGAFTKASATLYRLVVSPPANAAGDLVVSVAAGAFADLAGNASTTAASDTQPYDTRIALTQMSLPVTFDSATVDYAVVGFEGATSTLEADPTDATNTVVKVVKSGTAMAWAGTTITQTVGGAQIGFATEIPFDADNTRMTLKVYSPAVGTVVRLKAEDHLTSSVSVETDATTTASNAWETLTFDFADEAAGAPLSLTATYDKISVFIGFGTAGSGADVVSYFDSLVFIGGGGIGTGPVGPTTAPAAPTAAPADVISLLTAVYTNRTVDTWGTTWSNGGAGPRLTESTVQGVPVKSYAALQFVGIEFTSNVIDAAAAGMTHFHVDVWTPDMTNFQVKLVDFGADGAFAGGDDSEGLFTATAGSNPALTGTSQWVSLDIPLSAFAGTFNKAHLAQLLFVSGTGTGTAYVTNLYFHKVAAPVAPTTAPAAPTAAAADVISLLSSVYTNQPVTTWGTTWSNNDAGPRLSELTLEGTPVKKYADLIYVGIEFPALDVATPGMTHFHVDVWTPDITNFQVKLVDYGADGAFGGAGADADTDAIFTATAASTPALTGAGQWVSLDIPLASFAKSQATWGNGHLAQLLFVSGTGNGTAYVGNVYFHKVAGPSGFATVTFDDAGTTYTLTGFGGADDSTVVTDPAGGANKVAKVVKSATAETWAGTTVSTQANQAVGKIPFDAANVRMTVRVYSPDAGIKVRLKVEDAANNTVTCETEATTTVTNTWETLTFDFASPAVGTAAMDFAKTYDKASIFFDFGVGGATAGAKTYHFDDLTFIGGTSGGGGGGTAPAAAPAAPTAPAADVMSLLSTTYAGTAGDFSGRVGSYHASCFGPPGTTVADHTITGTSHAVKKYVFTGAGFAIIELLGATGGTATPPDSAICGGGSQTGASVIDVSGMTKIHFDVWSPGGSTNFQVHLVNADAGTISGPGQGTGATPGTQAASGALTVAAGQWVSFDVPFSTLGPPTSPSALTKIGLVKFFTTDAGTFFVDNVYFAK